MFHYFTILLFEAKQSEANFKSIFSFFSFFFIFFAFFSLFSFFFALNFSLRFDLVIFASKRSEIQVYFFAFFAFVTFFAFFRFCSLFFHFFSLNFRFASIFSLNFRLFYLSNFASEAKVRAHPSCLARSKFLKKLTKQPLLSAADCHARPDHSAE